MRSLFVKIFLWFWLAIVALGATLILVQRQWASAPALPTASAMAAYAAEAQRLLESGQRGAVARWLGALNRESEVHFLLVDSEGRGWPGRGLPPQLQQRLSARLRAAREGQPIRDPRLAAQPLAAGERQFYLVAIRPPRHRLEDAPVWVRLGAALGISALVSLLLAAHLSRPIRSVRQAAQQLAAGELDARVPPVRGRDEIAELGADFNAMADRLQQLLQAQAQLLRDVSHELRSPLHRMQVALELARRDAGAAAASSLDRIEREVERLNDLIGQVLALSRLEGGAVAPNFERFDLAELVREIVDDAAFEAGEQRSFACQVPERAELEGDAGLLHSAIENVIRNAVRHTPPGTAVEVALERGPGELVLRVRDHGPGLPASELERIFQPFVRVSAARERSSGGYGLGLAIAQHAVRLHGGTIKASNAASGGLAVTLRLPAAG